jgi:hypothetical protein
LQVESDATPLRVAGEPHAVHFALAVGGDGDHAFEAVGPLGGRRVDVVGAFGRAPKSRIA